MSRTIAFVQGTAKAPAPPPPPIPALPSSPGAGTGGNVVVTTIPGTPAQAAQDAAQAARDAAQVARDIAREARGQGPGDFTTSTGMPFNPDALLIEARPLFGMALAMVVVMFIGFPIVRAFIRRGEKRMELGAVRAQDLQPQIRQLQESLDAMAVELERISEAQRFQAKLMSERAPAVLPSERKG